MRVQVAYTVPVEVVINTDGYTIERVVVVDEQVRPDRDDCSKDGRSIHDENYGEVTDQGIRDAASAAAEDPANMWPAWEFGF